MSDQDNNIALFDRYLHNELSEEEQVQFQSRLVEDATFHEEFESYKNSVLILDSAGIAEDIGEIIETGEKSNIWIPVSIAASILLLLSLYFVFTPSTSSEELFQSYYQPYPNLVAMRSSEFEEMHKGLSAYGKGDYKSALDQFRSQDYTGDTLLFYHAIAHLSSNQPDSASILLKQISESSIFIQQATWYDALALLKQEKVEASKALLQKVKSGEFKYQESVKLLKQLDE